MKLHLYILLLSLYIWLSPTIALSQITQKERPFIWVQKKDKPSILHKIKTEEWANSFYHKFVLRVDAEVKRHQTDRNVFLNEFPFDFSARSKQTIPPFKTFRSFTAANLKQRQQISIKLKVAVDAGILYFLTNDPKYAQCALDILHTITESITKLTPSNKHKNGGWLYPGDHLREARVIGAQIPIIYDFIYPYLQKGAKPYDISSKSKVDFNHTKAQKVFKTYARLATEHGHRGSNWSVLEATSLVHNSLAIDDPKERQYFLDFFLNQGSPYQESLPEIAERYKNEGDVFPETSQYSNGVASIATKLMVLLTKYDATLELGKEYYKIPWALDSWDTFRYPNDEIIRFGDGHRTYRSNYDAYEMAYTLGKIDSVPKLVDKFVPLLTNSLVTKKYLRNQVSKYRLRSKTYDTPLRLLWFSGNFEKPQKKKPLSRTGFLPHAGIYLQRNLSLTKKPEDDLMCFVGGGHCVHGHANGMDLELYGQGLVLGVDNGRGKYRTELHENYSRLFAAHNTVIVNGASRGKDGWVQLGINTLKRIAMEPLPLTEALSPNYSFTRTSFKDDRGEKANAVQERTVALIRTSSTTGYYIDVFRSKSELPNEYHDYLYHNIGDKFSFTTKELSFTPDPKRYQKNAEDSWIQNKQYRNPGWHYFDEVHTSNNCEKDVKAQFEISKIKGKQIKMNLFISGAPKRNYTKVKAPPTFEAPSPYDTLPTPTLIIRKNGEAWKNPFAIIFEPKRAQLNGLGIQSVTTLRQDGIFKGFKIRSKTKTAIRTQYVIVQSSDEHFKDKNLQIDFTGGFAIISLKNNDQLENIYIGDGKSLCYKEIKIKAAQDKNVSTYIEFHNGKPEVISNDKILLSTFAE